MWGGLGRAQGDGRLILDYLNPRRPHFQLRNLDRRRKLGPDLGSGAGPDLRRNFSAVVTDDPIPGDASWRLGVRNGPKIRDATAAGTTRVSGANEFRLQDLVGKISVFWRACKSPTLGMTGMAMAVTIRNYTGYNRMQNWLGPRSKRE